MKKNVNNMSKYLGINFNVFVFIIFIIINLTPYISRITPITVNIVLMFLWFSTAFFSDGYYFTKFNKVSLFTLMWLFFLIIMQLVGFADDAIGNLLYYLIFWFSIIIYDYYSSHLNNNQTKLIVWIILVIMVINVLFNIYELVQNPKLSKLITGSVLSTQKDLNTNVGSYSFVFIVNIVMITFITLFTKSKSKIKKVIYLLIYISCYYMVILASSMIGILSGFIMIVTYIYILSTKNSRRRKIIFFVSIIIIILCSFFIKDNIYYFAIKFTNNMDNVYLKDRLSSIIYSLFGTSDQVSFSGRESLYIDSLVTFLKNPVIGVGRRHTNVEGIVGLHSQILDDVAYFGLIGIILQYLILYSFYKTHLHSFVRNNTVQKALIVSIIIGSIFFAFFNPMINRYSGLMIFIFIPLFCKLLSEEKEKSSGFIKKRL